jgi:hypothetical protein
MRATIDDYLYTFDTNMYNMTGNFTIINDEIVFNCDFEIFQAFIKMRVKRSKCHLRISP